MPHEFIPPTECPVCGTDVPRGARACPGCGADERSGWDEDAARYDGLDLPAEAYDETDAPRPIASSSHLLRNVVIIVTIVALLLLFVF